MHAPVISAGARAHAGSTPASRTSVVSTVKSQAVAQPPTISAREKRNARVRTRSLTCAAARCSSVTKAQPLQVVPGVPLGVERVIRQRLDQLVVVVVDLSEVAVHAPPHLASEHLEDLELL